MKLKHFLKLVLLFATLSNSAFAQKNDDATTPEDPEKITAENFNADRLERLVYQKVNAIRKTNNLDSLKFNDILYKASKDQAQYMAKRDEATVQGKGKKATTGDRVSFYGGGESAEELVIAQVAGKSKTDFTYDEIADLIAEKWNKGKQAKAIVGNANYFYGAVGADIEPETRKIYVSMVFGSFETFNIGADKRNELPVPFTKKRYRLRKVEKPADEKKFCKACNKFKDMDKLIDGLYVQDGKIYLKYDNYKAIQKLMKKPKDGLAVDVIQREQYPCQPYNIYDTKKVNKGVMKKRKWSKWIFKHNILPEPPKTASKKKKKSSKKKKPKTLNVFLADFPAEITGEYEINLMVIQNKRVCRTLSRKYLEDGGIKSRTPLETVPDTGDGRKALKYKPVVETRQLGFKIPFAQGKHEYKRGDLEPLLPSLMSRFYYQ